MLDTAPRTTIGDQPGYASDDLILEGCETEDMVICNAHFSTEYYPAEPDVGIMSDGYMATLTAVRIGDKVWLTADAAYDAFGSAWVQSLEELAAEKAQ